MQDRFIPVAAPMLIGNEKAYVVDCIESTWISSMGKYVQKFERAFADFCGCKHGVSSSNGTTALHAALMALGVGPGDEVIVPTLTFVATANTVVYCGAKPVFADSEPDTWNIDPARIEAKITPRTKGIVPVHLFGHPAEMDLIMDIARRHGLFVLEDAAEAHGAKYKGRRVGSIGNAGAFSFYGNKIVTTGEGGMVVTDDEALADQMSQLRDQGMDPHQRYWHTMIGYNYRMTNVTAAIGLAQMEKVDWHIARRLEVASWYQQFLCDVSEVSWQPEQPWAKHVYWMFSILLSDEASLSRDELMARLRTFSIETRPVFHPSHMLPPYREATAGESFPVAEDIARRGISLPTWGGLTIEDVQYVCDSLKACLSSPGP